MIRRPPRSTRTDTLFPYTTLFRSFITGRLEADIFPIVGKQEISRITLEDIRKALRNIEARGALETAPRMRAHCSAIFRFSIAEGYRSEERRVGNAWVSLLCYRWSPYLTHNKTNSTDQHTTQHK